jgi:5,10-methylenetetrahydromethanopterin reductase
VRYGLVIETTGQQGSASGLAGIVADVRATVDAGIPLAATSQIFGHDALTLLAAIGQQVPDIELATAVVPTYPRHPIVLASQALTVQQVIGGRLTLGIGLSHKLVIEGVFGYSFDRPVRHMSDYLRVLLPLLRGEQVSYEGDTLKAATLGPLDISAPTPDVLVAALGPQMLKLAGRLADGTATWMTGRATIEGHIVPSITKAATDAGRTAPRVSVSLPVCVTDDPAGARERAAGTFAIYGQLPSYRAMLDREGVEGPAGVALVGDEDSVAKQIAALGEAGATEFVAARYGSSAERDRTFQLIAELSRGASG